MLDVESGNIISFSDVDCQFGYRDSIFKRNVGLLLEATFFLEEGDSEKIRASTREKIEYRRSNHPMDLPSLGSTFKNVPISDFPGEIPEEFPIKTDPFPVVPAAYLISKAGLSGARSGGAEISQKHPNFIVNLGEAKAADIKKLISSIKETVKEKFGVDLKEEIQIL
jgi:UDP-N-acetylmuramate dehydrogenase